MNIIQTVYEIEGVISSVKDSMSLLFDLTEVVKLTPVAFYANIFPTVGGKGGEGITATINFVESYAVIDSWPEREYIHLNIVSCKMFDRKKVYTFLTDRFIKVKEYNVFNHENIQSSRN